MGSKATVLVVDDFAGGRRVVERILTTDSNYRVLGAETGERALALAMEYCLSLVILDVELPDMPAWKVAERLRAGSNNRDVPILFLTARDDSEMKATCQRVGCNGILLKPVQRDELLRHVEWPLRTGELELNDSSANSQRISIVVDSVIADLVPGYLDNRRRDLAKIDLLLKTQKYTDIAIIAHNMKGSGSSYGMPEVSDIGNKMEVASHAHDNLEILRLQDLLAKYVDRVQLP